MSNSRNRLAAAVSADIDERQFYSRDGDDIRVTHPGGSVAIVGEEPRTLPKHLHRAAIKNGCQILEPGESLSAAQRTTVEENDPGTDAFTRKNAIKAAMLDALQADEDDANYADAFTANDIPNVRWLEKKVGFSLSADERNTAWAEVQSENDNGDDGDNENEDEDE